MFSKHADYGRLQYAEVCRMHRRMPVVIGKMEAMRTLQKQTDLRTDEMRLECLSTRRRVLYLLAAAWMLFEIATAPSKLLAADDGFNRVSGEHIELVTDLPLDDAIRELPAVFDAAFPFWCREFHVTPAECSDWKVTAYLMGARERFKAAGYLPSSLPPFQHGYQFGNDLWVVEQPSDYYRRHLLLHEGTHWFMVKRYGSAGPPWLMEGLAEWLATHRWNHQELQMGIIPSSREDVPMWGRITLIQEQLNDGLAPSLEAILRYDGRAHQSPDAYAWSWAAVIFFRNHSATRPVFDRLLGGALSNDGKATPQILQAIRSRKSLVRTEWAAMMTSLEYGFDPDRELARLALGTPELTGPVKFQLDTKSGWQNANVKVAVGQVFDVKATGRYLVQPDPVRNWESEANGLTLRYERAQPLGKLLLAIAEPMDKEPEFSERLACIPCGNAMRVKADKSGTLLFRINEYGTALRDNSGELTIQITPVAQP